MSLVPLRSHRGWRRFARHLLGFAAWSPGIAGATPPTPTDPNDAPMMREPKRQPPRTGDRKLTFEGPARERGRPHVSTTVAPLFASLFAPFVGRPDRPLPGGGVEIGVGLRGSKAWGAEIGASYSGHPVSAEQSLLDDGTATPTAAAGTYHALIGRAGVTYRVDLGRLVPRLGVGTGVFALRSPAGVRSGQRDRAGMQSDDGTDCSCELGLACAGAPARCVPRPELHVYADLAVDVLLFRRWALGAGARYFAFPFSSAPIPAYLNATLRLRVRL